MSVASTKTMHIHSEMQHKHLSQHHCSDLHDSHEKHNHVKQKHDGHSHHMHMCDQQTENHQAAHQTDCHKCSILLCQPSITWLDHKAPHDQIPEYLEENLISFSSYQIQYPTEYWKKILRPPRV